jgi:hypothetical protein
MASTFCLFRCDPELLLSAVNNDDLPVDEFIPSHIGGSSWKKLHRSLVVVFSSVDGCKPAVCTRVAAPYPHALPIKRNPDDGDYQD